MDASKHKQERNSLNAAKLQSSIVKFSIMNLKLPRLIVLIVLLKSESHKDQSPSHDQPVNNVK
jgi:hypothetical protein